jgi:uncharacterized protein YbjT (DUF2867 family)
VVTGANGNLGRRLVAELAAIGEAEIVAVVRSEHAASAIAAHEAVTTKVLSYTDVAALRDACIEADCVVHLVGIIKEGGGASYHEAHEGSTGALCEALRDRPNVHVSYLSIVGAEPNASNSCLASKGRAERILHEAPNPTCTLRVPMVLGERDYVSRSLRRRVLKEKAVGFRMESIEQPIYAGDVTAAIKACAIGKIDAGIDLGGPEVLSRAELSRRAGQVFGRAVTVRSLPIAMGKLLAVVLQALLANPPITPAMLEILDHDDNVDNAHAFATLGLTGLTGLDEMLRSTLAGDGLP